MDPIQRSADVKRGFLLHTETLVFNNENKPRFASASVLNRIRASPRDLNGSDQTGTAILSHPDEYG